MKILDSLLDFGEEKLGVNVRYYAKNTSYLLLLEGILTMISIAFTVVFTRVMPQEDFGIYNFVFSVIGVLSIASLQGINISLMRSVSRGFEGDLMAGTKARVKWSLLGTGAMFLVALYYYLTGSGIYPYILLGGIFFTSYTALGTTSSFLYGKSQFKRATKLSILFQLVTIGFGAVIIFLVRDLFWILFAVLFLSSTAQLALLEHVKRGRANDRTNPETISYGKHLSLNQLVLNVIPHADRVIIGALLGFVDVAVYSISLQLSEKVKKFLYPITNVIFPNLSKMEEKQAYTIVRKKLAYFFLLGIAIAVVGVLLSPAVIVILFTEQYAQAIFFTQILFVSLAFAVPSLVLNMLLQTQQATRKLYIYNTSTSVIEIILLFVFIALYGVWGAVLTRLITRAYMVGILLRLTSTGGHKTP